MQDFEKNAEAQRNIKDILDKTENDIKEGKIVRRSAEGGAEEFVFSDGIGLVFDQDLPEKTASLAEEKTADDAREVNEPLVSYERNLPRVEEVTVVADSKEEVITLDPPAGAEEFSLPSSFVVDEKYNTPISEEKRTLYSTYVPKFTDASENYRMASEPRPQRKIPRPLSVDPTAEEEKETEGAVIVESGASTPAVEAVFNVSKPIAEATLAESTERTLETERAEIESLLAPEVDAGEEGKEGEEIAAAFVGAPAASLEEDAPFVREAVALETEPYSIPDPDEGTVRIFDYPQDIGEEKLPEAVKPAPLSHHHVFGAKEYVNAGQKIAFKDMFLDRLNSVAVRLGAALILTLILCFIENVHLIGVDALAFLGFTGFPFALVLLDMQIVVCLLLLAAPEIMRGIKALTKGLFHTELLLPIAFLLQMVCTVTVMLSVPSVQSLYGFVFGLFTIATIAASYLRHRAAFVTFTNVGGREEKIVVDKKMTRLLEKEKFALDGAVDEYKSKVAQISRATFVSDFFARERKSAESTRRNLKYLLLSLGVSLTAAVLMFLVGDGMKDATATLAVTFYLSAPAAIFLSHRLPYYLSARIASSEGGGVIGETSHYDYAGVDVICFKDTEIFEKGDVALKHIILYDTAKEFTTVVEQMSSLFSVIGGPLDVLFSSTLVKKSPAADEAVLEDIGIYGRIGNATLHVGSEAYIASKGIALPKEKDNRENVDAATRVMYAAENGRVYAKFYLQYKLSDAYNKLLAIFAEEKIVSLVYTKDPNIDGALMKHLASDRDLIRVIVNEEMPASEAVSEKASVGLVSAVDKSGAISLLLLCRRYVRMQKNLVSATLLAMGSGAFLGIMLSIFGLLRSLPSIAYGVWQVALVAVLGVYAWKRLLPPGCFQNRGNSKK